MKVSRGVFLLLVLAFAELALAEPRPMDSLSFLLDGSWRATFPDGRGTDTHRFRTMLGGQYLRDTHEVRGRGAAYAGETIYAWRADQQLIEYWYFNTLGGVSQGRVESVGDRWVLPETHRDAQGAVREFRTVMTRTGPDRMEWRLVEKAGAAWTPVWTMNFVRTRD